MYEKGTTRSSGLPSEGDVMAFREPFGEPSCNWQAIHGHRAVWELSVNSTPKRARTPPFQAPSNRRSNRENPA